MNDYFIGGIGKDLSWGLVSEHPFIVFDEKSGQFSGFPTLSEATSYLDSADHKVYAFSQWTACWQRVDFAAEGTAPSKPAIGFNPG